MGEWGEGGVGGTCSKLLSLFPVPFHPKDNQRLTNSSKPQFWRPLCVQNLWPALYGSPSILTSNLKFPHVITPATRAKASGLACMA
jgi:hypothetical protein